MNLAIILFTLGAGVSAQTVNWYASFGDKNINSLLLVEEALFAQSAHSLYKLNVQNGNVFQSYALPESGSPKSLQAFEKRGVTHFIVSTDEKNDIVQFDPITGDIRWTSHHYQSVPIIDTDFGTIYAIKEGKLQAMDSMTGDVVWTVDCDKDAQISISNGLVHVAANQNIQVYGKESGTLEGEVNFEGRVIMIGGYAGTLIGQTLTLYSIAGVRHALLKVEKLEGDLIEKAIVLENENENDSFLIQTNKVLYKITKGKIEWSHVLGGMFRSWYAKNNQIYILEDSPQQGSVLVQLVYGKRAFEFPCRQALVDIEIGNNSVFLLSRDSDRANIYRLETEAHNGVPPSFAANLMNWTYRTANWVAVKTFDSVRAMTRLMTKQQL